jgi:hypothetical protein
MGAFDTPMEQLLKACGFSATVGESYTWPPDGAPPLLPHCPHCGVPVTLDFVLKPGRASFYAVAHPLPVCAEFAREFEDAAPI